MDEALIGTWRVTGTDMVVGRTVRLIGGLPAEFVEFTSDGRYRVDLANRRPGESRYRTSVRGDRAELDIWIAGLEALGAHCIYCVAGDTLTICIAGDSRARPTELRRDDELLWCLMTFERSDPHKRRQSGRVEPLTEPGLLNPTAFLKKGRKRDGREGAG